MTDSEHRAIKAAREAGATAYRVGYRTGRQGNVDEAAAIWLRSISSIAEFCTDTLGYDTAEGAFILGWIDAHSESSR